MHGLGCLAHKVIVTNGIHGRQYSQKAATGRLTADKHLPGTLEPYTSSSHSTPTCSIYRNYKHIKVAPVTPCTQIISQTFMPSTAEVKAGE